MLQNCFGPSLVKRWKEELVTPVLRSEYVEPMRSRGKADLVQEFGAGFPVRIISAILGFPEEPEAIAQFAEWRCAWSRFLPTQSYCQVISFNDSISITNRYRTSAFTVRSYASSM